MPRAIPRSASVLWAGDCIEAGDPATEDVFETCETCDVCELCRRGITGRFFFVALVATNPGFFLVVADDFLSAFVFSTPTDEGGCTTTWEFEPADETGSVSCSDSCGETNRAVGRGPVVEGPLVFFNIGCGMTVGGLDKLEDELVLCLVGRGGGLCKSVALDASMTNWAFFFYKSKIQYGMAWKWA